MSVQNQYVGGSEARRLTGYSWGRLSRLALVGQIRTELRPGCTPRYLRADLEALRDQAPQPNATD